MHIDFIICSLMLVMSWFYKTLSYLHQNLIIIIIIIIPYVYGKTSARENFRVLSGKMVIRSKTFAEALLYRLILLIDKAIFGRKTFAFEWKTAKVSPRMFSRIRYHYVIFAPQKLITTCIIHNLNYLIASSWLCNYFMHTTCTYNYTHTYCS